MRRELVNSGNGSSGDARPPLTCFIFRFLKRPLKAWQNQEGPFNFEGRHFQHRQVNIWPRPYSDLHKRVWVTVGSGPSTVPVAKHGHVCGVFLAGYGAIRKIFDAYRAAYEETHGRVTPLDRLAYCALVSVGETEEDARATAEQLLWYMHTSKGAPQFSNPPGYHPPHVAAKFMQPQVKAAPATVDGEIRKGNMFCGTPDKVFEQIKTFYEYSGGFGQLMGMFHAGLMKRETASKSATLYAREVMPRLQELVANYDKSKMDELRAATPDIATGSSMIGQSTDFVR